MSSIHKDLKTKWIVVTPDNLSELVKNAKLKELEMYPETRSFPQISHEYIPSSVPQSNLCKII